MFIRLIISLAIPIVSSIYCDEVCIQVCDPSAPDGCGSYCCPEYSKLTKQENCDCKLSCVETNEISYDCNYICTCQNLKLVTEKKSRCENSCLSKCSNPDEDCISGCEIICKGNEMIYIGFAGVVIIFIGVLLAIRNKIRESNQEMDYHTIHSS